MKTIAAAGLAVTLAGPAAANTPDDRGFEIAARSDRSDVGFGSSRVELQMILRNAAGQESTRKLEISTLEKVDEDVGDLVLYGKFRKSISNSVMMGGGLEMSVPTGRESKRMGTGELAFNPFVNVRYTRGRIALGGHVGFYMSDGNVAEILAPPGGFDLTIRTQGYRQTIKGEWL